MSADSSMVIKPTCPPGAGFYEMQPYGRSSSAEGPSVSKAGVMLILRFNCVLALIREDHL